MRREPCLSPLTAPAHKSDDDAVPVQVVSHVGEHNVAGVKPPVDRLSF